MFFRKRRCCGIENKLCMDCRAFTFPSLRESGSKEWISCAHGAVSATILRIFGEEFGQRVVLDSGSNVGVIPRELVSRHSPLPPDPADAVGTASFCLRGSLISPRLPRH